MYLKRYHNITLSKSGIWRILKRLNMNLLPTSQRYKRHKDRWIRYEKTQPGHRLQIDVKFLERIQGKRERYYQYTAIQFVDYVLSRLPFHNEVIQTDNRSEFQGQFHWHKLDKGINHVYIKPRTLDLMVKWKDHIELMERSFTRC